jgi:hypothetical protein
MTKVEQFALQNWLRDINPYPEDIFPGGAGRAARLGWENAVLAIGDWKCEKEKGE